MAYYGLPEDQQIPPQPPYNATNFTPANAVIYNMMVNVYSIQNHDTCNYIFKLL